LLRRLRLHTGIGGDKEQCSEKKVHGLAHPNGVEAKHEEAPLYWLSTL
jgi:hypothetical protein